MKRSTILLGFLSPFFTHAQMNAGALLPGNHRFEVPFRTIDSEIRIPVSFRDKSYDFMFDTGAPVFISKELQQEHRFPVLMNAVTSDASGLKDSMAIVLVDTLRSGPFTLVAIPALVLDLGSTGIHCKGLVGNFGSNAARFLHTDFDLANERLTLTSRTDDPEAPTTTYLPMHLSAQSDVFVPIVLNGAMVDSAHFDSGSGSTLELAPAPAQRFATTYPDQVAWRGFGISSFGMFGPGPATDQYLLRPDVMSIGGRPIGKPLCEIAVNGISRIGRGVLRHGRLELDYPRSRYRFIPYANALGSEEALLGFELVISRSTVIIGTVWEGSAAERAGLKGGDRLRQVGKLTLDELDECELETALNLSLKARPLELVVEDADGLKRTIRYEP